MKRQSSSSPSVSELTLAESNASTLAALIDCAIAMSGEEAVPVEEGHERFEALVEAFSGEG